MIQWVPMDRHRMQAIIVVAGVTLGVIIAATVPGVIEGENDAGSGPRTVLAVSPSPNVYPAVWAIESGGVELPANVVFRRYLAFDTAIANGTVDAGNLGVSALAARLEGNPDITLTGQALYPGPRALALYVRPGSDIQNITDLSGRRIATPPVNRLLLAQLSDETQALDLTPVNTFFPAERLLGGEVAAAIAPSGHEELRPLLYPVERIEAEGGARFTQVYWFSDGTTHLENSRAAARVFDEALARGYNNIETAATDYRGGGDPTDIWEAYRNTTVIDLTEEDVALTQSVLESAARRGYIEEPVDLTQHMVRE